MLTSQEKDKMYGRMSKLRGRYNGFVDSLLSEEGKAFLKGLQVVKSYTDYGATVEFLVIKDNSILKSFDKPFKAFNYIMGISVS